MSNSPSSKALLVLALSGALGVGALAYYVKAEPGADKIPASLTREAKSASQPEVKITRAPSQKTEADQDAKNEVETEVSMPKIRGMEATLDESTTKVPDHQDPLKFVAAGCLKQANIDDVKVLDVQVSNNIAVVNFDDNIDSGMGGEQEAAFLKALQVGFGQFDNVKQIVIDKNGSPVTTLGSIDISSPLRVIRKGSPENQSPTP